MNSLQEWISLFTKRGTKKARSLAVRKYLTFIYGLSFQGPSLEPYEPYAKQYLNELTEKKRSLVTDMTRFVAEITDDAPNTQSNIASGVIVWLRDNDIELTQGERKRIFRQSPPARTITQDIPFTRQDLIKVIAHAPIQLKALIYVLSSSGMRIGECLQLRDKDIDLSADPITIYLPKNITKNRLPRITFISSEAKPMLLEWLKYRGHYLELKKSKNGYWKEGEDRIFPFLDKNADAMLRNALIKAEIMKRDRYTNRSVLHMHTLRKYFRTQLVKGGNGNAIDMVEKLMGHEGYLTNAYVKVNEDELREFYRQAEHYLFIQQAITMKDPEAEKRIADQEQRIKELEEKLAANEKILSLIKENFDLTAKK